MGVIIIYSQTFANETRKKKYQKTSIVMHKCCLGGFWQMKNERAFFISWQLRAQHLTIACSWFTHKFLPNERVFCPRVLLLYYSLALFHNGEIDLYIE